MKEKRELRPLDFVLTPKNNIALVTETHVTESGIIQASIEFINPRHDYERNAWWNESELKVINTLPYILSKEMSHPFGNGHKKAKEHFGI